MCPPMIANTDLPMILTSTVMDTNKGFVMDSSDGRLKKEETSPNKVNDVQHEEKRSYT